MSLNLKGKLVKILGMESGVSRNGNAWKKQEFILETQEQFPRKVCFTLFNDKVSLLSNFSGGEDLEVSFDVESREFNGKWYHNINAWKIEKTGQKSPAEIPPPFSADDVPPEILREDQDDLPF